MSTAIGNRHEPDKLFFILTVILIVAGLLIFTSASMGLLNRDGASFAGVAFTQLVLGLGLGSIGGFILYRLPYLVIRKLSFYLFIFSIIVTALVFVPGLGFKAGGAQSWLRLGSFSFQPAELLKFGFVLFFSSWLATIGTDIKTWRYGILPALCIMTIPGVLLILQPDHGTFLTIYISGLVMLFVSGIRWRDLGIIFLMSLLLLTALVITRPYILARITTFMNSENDPLGSSYQVRQALIAIGSGGITGRGYGQSIQKFGSLPEPTGDSIFAVLSEEFGFIGSFAVVAGFFIFASRALILATRSRDSFARLAIVGIVIIIVSQSFINIATMVGVFPLTGVPLVFISHGGTALMFAIFEVGLVLQFSRYTNKT